MVITFLSKKSLSAQTDNFYFLKSSKAFCTKVPKLANTMQKLQVLVSYFKYARQSTDISQPVLTVRYLYTPQTEVKSFGVTRTQRVIAVGITRLTTTQKTFLPFSTVRVLYALLSFKYAINFPMPLHLKSCCLSNGRDSRPDISCTGFFYKNSVGLLLTVSITFLPSGFSASIRACP